MESASEVALNSVDDKCVSVEDLAPLEDLPAEEEANIANKKPGEKEEDKAKNEESPNESKQVVQNEVATAIAKESENEQVTEEEDEEEEELEESVEEEEQEDDDAEADADKLVNQEVVTDKTETSIDDQPKVTTLSATKKVMPDDTAETSVETTITTIGLENETPDALNVATELGESDAMQADTKEQEKNTEVEHENEVEEITEETSQVEDKVDESERRDVVDAEQPVNALQQQLDKYQHEPDTHSQVPITTSKKQAAIEDNSGLEQTNQPPATDDDVSNKQENFNNTIKAIMSNIDSNIQAQETIAALKERELDLLRKQQELAREIEKQKLLSQKLANENQYEQHYNNKYISPEINITPITYPPIVSKYSTFEEKQDNNIYSRKSETFEKRECTNVSKKIDLHKIFTPATDAEEILPKNRKLYASSAFYSPTLHPTVEDQVELARRISHSLSDISNQQSRGQSMYVNRKKRSVKWVHEGSGQDDTENENVANENENGQNGKENDATSHQKNTPLKFLMNPSGQMRDINSLRESINTETGLLSPDTSAEVVNALQTHKGKGAELFAKRRKVAEKWVVDESNVGAQSPSGLPDYHQYQQQPKISTSPSILPAYTDAAKHRVQLNLHQEQLLEKYAKPGLKVVQTPWEAALTSGSASAAFIEEQNLSPFPTSTLTPSPTPQIFDASQGVIPSPDSYTVPDGKSFSSENYYRYRTSPTAAQQQTQHERQLYPRTSSNRELAYKPSIPQGWKAPSMSLPKDLYMPKDIPLKSYAAPPVTIIRSPESSYPSSIGYETSTFGAYQNDVVLPVTKPYRASTTTFPVSKSYQQGFSSTYGSTQPPRQQYLPPESYQKVQQNTSQNVPQVNFSPSALPYDKLAKFENPPPADEGHCPHSPSSRISYLNVRGSKVRNTSPAPFTSSDNRSYTPSFDGHYCGGRRSVSPRPFSSPQLYRRHNTPNYAQPIVTSNQLLNAPSYNTSARGWGCGSSGGGGATSGYHYQQSHLIAAKPQIVNASSVPYTDF